MLARLLDHRTTERQLDLALFLLRLTFGIILVWGTQDNVFHHERMLEFRDFVRQNGFPAPLFSAYLSAYAQFIAGILLVLGALTRLTAGVMIINFLAALAMVHWGLPFSANISPVAMLCFAVVLLIAGPGAWSVDARRTTGRSANR
jgi:putative oxidoreductase